MERTRSIEKTYRSLVLGLVGLGLLGCDDMLARKDYSYYEPVFNAIVYNNDDPSEEDIFHEEEHKKRANEYPYGRIGWGYRYVTDEEFACDEEQWSNLAANTLPTDKHLACIGIDHEVLKK